MFFFSFRLAEVLHAELEKMRFELKECIHKLDSLPRHATPTLRSCAISGEPEKDQSGADQSV